MNHGIVTAAYIVAAIFFIFSLAGLSRQESAKNGNVFGIVVVVALLQIGHGNGFVSALAFVAVLIASINIFGGFYVTRRMLNMFRKG